MRWYRYLKSLCQGNKGRMPMAIPKDRTEAAERVLATLREQADALEVEASVILRRRRRAEP